MGVPAVVLIPRMWKGVTLPMRCSPGLLLHNFACERHAQQPNFEKENVTVHHAEELDMNTWTKKKFFNRSAAIGPIKMSKAAPYQAQT